MDRIRIEQADFLAQHAREQHIVPIAAQPAADHRHAALLNAAHNVAALQHAHLLRAQKRGGNGKPLASPVLLKPVGQELHGHGRGAAHAGFARVVIGIQRIQGDGLEHLRRDIAALKQVAQRVGQRRRAAVVLAALIIQHVFHGVSSFCFSKASYCAGPWRHAAHRRSGKCRSPAG